MGLGSSQGVPPVPLQQLLGSLLPAAHPARHLLYAAHALRLNCEKLQDHNMIRPCNESRRQVSVEPSAPQVGISQSLLTLPACDGRSLRESQAPLLCCGDAQQLLPHCCCLVKQSQTILVVYLLSVPHHWAFCSGSPLVSRQDPLLSPRPLSAEEAVTFYAMLEPSTAVAARVKRTLQDALTPLGPMMKMMKA